MKAFGHFDDANREYVITDPKTPWPWINYLGNEDFFSLISNTAGGYSFYKDAKFRRPTASTAARQAAGWLRRQRRTAARFSAAHTSMPRATATTSALRRVCSGRTYLWGQWN